MPHTPTKGSSLRACWIHWYVSRSGFTLASKVWAMILSSLKEKQEERAVQRVHCRERSKINLNISE